jgi:photosystem II stability/assembly factor-like uncharacterized protein
MVAAGSAVAVALAAATVVLAACGIMSGPARSGTKVVPRASTGRVSTTTAPSTLASPSTTTSTTTLLPLLYSPQPGALLQFVSPSIGWFGTGSAILGTTDGGRTWQTSFKDAESGPDSAVVGQVQSIDFVNGSDGWALIDGRGLVATRNGGGTWTTPAEPSQGPIVVVTFDGPEDGWANTDQGVLLSTVDGGGSWMTRATPEPVVTLCATPWRTWFGAGSGDIYTSAAGATWRLSLSGAAVVSPFHNTVGPTNPKPPTPWLACTGGSAWALYQYGEAAGSDPFVVERTFNGGVDWTEPISLDGAAPVASPTGIIVTAAVAAPAPTSAWISGYCGPCGPAGIAIVARSADGSAFAGVTMPGPPDTTSGFPVGLSFLDATVGWAAVQERPAATTEGGPPTDALLRTDDGGSTWVVVNAGVAT